MGKGDKKKFIGKDEGTKFYVLHRSQTDTAYAQEAEPSKYVLFPAQGSASSAAATSASLGSAVQLQLSSQKDHINSLGFKNDGYDYSKHLKEMGGGKFIGRDSKVVDLPMPEGHYSSSSSSSSPSSAATVGGLTLPEEALAGGDKGRDLTAITISQECMDEDLKAALWEDADEDGEFETLDDDFVAQVMQEPETKDFDFEAHIARLIAQSEEKTVAARPWGDEVAGGDNSNSNSKSKGAKASAGRKAAASSSAAAPTGEDDDEEWEDEDEGEDDDSGYFDADAALEDDDDDDDCEDDSDDDDDDGAGRGRGRGGGGTDEHFERVLDEYDEDAIGGLSDEEEDDIGGMLEADDDKLSAAIEEFLRDAKDNQLAEGVAKPAKGLRSIPNLEKYVGKEAAEEEGEMTAERLKAAVAEQEELQQEMYEYIESYNRKQRSARHRNGAAAHDNNGSAHNKSKTHSSGLEHGELTGMNASADDESRDEAGTQANGDEDDDAFLLSCQEYLRELKVEEEWDCETILSTYSVLDNHPTVIAAEPSTRRKKSSRKGGAGGDGASSVGGYSGIGGSAYSNSMSHRSGKWGADPNPQQMEFRSKFNEMVRRHNEGLKAQSAAGAGADASASGGAAPKVQFVLKGKHSLPEVQPLAPISDSSSGRSSVQDYVNGVLMTERRKKQLKNGRGHKAREVGGGLAIPASIPEDEDEDEDEVEQGESDEDDEDEGEEGEEEGEGQRQRGEKVPRRRRNETKEEKKARKQAAKALKTERKQVKKQNKLSFKGEEQRMVAAAAKGQEINNISVFKYSH